VEVRKVYSVLSKPIVDEYVAVLQRMGLEGEQELGELLGLFAHGIHALFTAARPEMHIVEKDPDDDKFIECAIALKARCIISGDKSFLAIGDYLGIRIMTPRASLDMNKGH
jgi:predicted nucleic acid-binding protein